MPWHVTGTYTGCVCPGGRLHCEEKRGLAPAVHSQFQPVPTGSGSPSPGHSPAPQNRQNAAQQRGKSVLLQSSKTHTVLVCGSRGVLCRFYVCVYICLYSVSYLSHGSTIPSNMVEASSGYGELRPEPHCVWFYLCKLMYKITSLN